MLHKNLIGNTCYNASAGSGKTTTIVNTIIDAYNNGIDTSKALILTFESSAKTVMEKRLKKAKVKSMPYVSTIHALAYRILKENSGKYYRVLSDYDQINMISDVLKTYPKDKTKSPYYYISLFSNYNVSARNTKICSMETSELDIFRKYESAKLKKNMIDFGDMLYYGYELLLNKSIQKHYAEIFKYVIVDEYQDMGECAYLMINLLSEINKNLFVVGDMKQCLIEGSKIKIGNNKTKNIENIVVGDKVIASSGKTRTDEYNVTDVFKKKIYEKIFCIKTDSGKIIKSTKSHIHFADYEKGNSDNFHIVYLMYKKSFGYRIGLTRRYNSKTSDGAVGIKKRLTFEGGDKIWILETHDSEKIARQREVILSLKYQIPTIVFKSRDDSQNSPFNNIESIKNIFEAVSEFSKIDDIFNDYNLFFDYPVHIPQSADKNNFNFTIKICGTLTGNSARHSGSFNTNDINIYNKLKNNNINVLPYKRGGHQYYRVRKESKDLYDLFEVYKDIKKVIPDINLIQHLRRETTLMAQTASNVHRGMVMFTEDGIEEVVETWQEDYDGFVYDINVDKVHNFVANGIFTHNSIYGFSMASPKYIQNFENTHDNTSRVFMNHTYRTPKCLMEAVNYIAIDLDDEEITTKSERVGSITTTKYQNEHEQSEQIISKIKNEMMNINDTAILMRTNSQAIWFQKECILNNIPFYSKKKTFMESAIAKTILSYIRFIDSNMSDVSALADIINRPYRNVPKKTIDTLRKYKNTISFLKTNDRISGISKINDIIKICIAIRERVDNVHQLINAIVREFDLIRYFSENLYIKDTAEKIEEFRDFLVDIDDIPKILSICDNIYKNRKSKLGLSILTIHSSKGMEFKNVFVVNVNNGSIPHQNSDDVMEELRLFYVAITRTIENLYCSYVLFKGNNMIQPSPFMKYLE